MANDITNLIDVPLAAGEQDLLGLEKYTSALVEFIANAQLPTTLAIQGEWGSGKTSLMNQIRYRLCSNENDGKPYYGIWINTWQYSLMRDSNEIILNIIEGITSEVVKIIKEKNSPFLNESLHKLSSCFRSVAKVGAKVAATSIGLNANVIDEIMAEKNVGSNQYAFRDSFENAIKRCLENDNRQRQKNKRGFLFFIDDLDRIEPALSVKLLEIMKNLFEVDNCFFVLAIDYDVVVKGLIPRFGEMTEKNEREFRSFFDKIVQLPFTMPTAAYAIGDYVGKNLQQIGFLTKGEFRKNIPLYLEDGEKYISVNDSIIKFVENSTGTNPRSIKRLINTLSLIKIITHAEDTDSIEDLMYNKLMFFGLVCIQISYPSIYNLLYKEPNFLQWDNDFVRSCGIKNKDAEEENEEFERNDIEEEWEKSVYRLCANNKYLMKRILNITNLFNFINDISSDEEKLSRCVSSLIGLTSITSVDRSSTSEVVSRRDTKTDSYESIEEISKYTEENNYKKSTIDTVKLIFDDITKIFSNNVRILFSTAIHTSLTIIAKNPKSRTRIVSKNWIHKRLIWLSGGFKVCSIEDYKKIREEYLKNMIDSYNNITREEYQIKTPDTGKEEQSNTQATAASE